MSVSDPSRPPILPPPKPDPQRSGVGSSSTSPGQSGPPSRLQLSSGLSSGDTSPSSSDEDEIVFAQSPPPKVRVSSTELAGSGSGPGKSRKRARESTPQSDTADQGQQPTESSSAAPIKLTNKQDTVDQDDKPDVRYCHQDHQARNAPDTLTCTNTKSTGKACTLSFCNRCLLGRYGEDLARIVAKGNDRDWKCPVCRGICNCSKHRRDSGLLPTGNLTKMGKSAIEVLKKNPSAAGPSSKPKPRASISSTTSAKGKSKANGTTNGAAKSKSKSKANNGTGEPDSSDLSDLSTDEDTTPATKKQKGANGQAVPAPDGPKPKRAPPPPRPPKLYTPPRSYSLAPSPDYMPPTSSLLARLNMREFLIRFRHLMPSIRGDNNRQRQILAATEDVMGFWRNDGEVGQRALLAALLELIEGEEEKVLNVGEDESVQAVKRARKEAHASSFTSHGEAISRPWETMKKVVEDEGLWKHPEDSWAIQRGVEDEGSREKRSGRIKVQVDERLRVLEGLMEISFRSQEIRSDMLEGVEVDRQAGVDLRKEKYKLRNEWQATKTKLVESKPEKPEEKPKQSKAAAATALEVWEKEVAKIDREIKKGEKAWEHEEGRINRKLFIASAAARLRFNPIGTDLSGRDYYLLAPTPEQAYPLSARVEDDGFPLAWSILIHGKSFVAPTVPGAPGPKANGASSPTKGATPNGKRAATQKPAVNGDTEGDRVDSWTMVCDPAQMVQLANFVEYEAKVLDFGTRYAYWEKVKADLLAGGEAPPPRGDKVGRKKVVPGDDEHELKVAELVGGLRAFGEGVMWEKSEAAAGLGKGGRR